MKLEKGLNRLPAVFFALFLSVVFFLVILNFQNRFTHSDSTIKNGELSISASKLSEKPYRFIGTEWKFYPDELLTPDTIENKKEEEGYAAFDRKKFINLIDGCGSYVLKLRLPQGKHTYGLEIPHMYSAYKIYVNDKMMLQSGNPDKNGYTESAQDRMINFESEGDTTIIIAASNYSNFLGGIQKPLIFGTQLAVNVLRAARIGINIFVMVIFLLISLLSLYLKKKMKERQAGIFALLCLAAGSTAMFPVLHASIALPVHPFNSLELLSAFMVTALSVMLFNQLCNTSTILRKVSNSFVLLFCTGMFIYAMASDGITETGVTVSAVFTLIFRIASAIYLLSAAFVSVKKNTAVSAALLYSALFYGVSCTFTYVYPLYEPIFAGKYMEWGNLALTVSVGYILWKKIATVFKYHTLYDEEHRQMTRQLGMQMEYTKQLGAQLEENKKMNHDIRHHLRVISMIAQSDADRQVQEYISKVAQSLEETSNIQMKPMCRNIALDALLRYYRNIIWKKGIQFESQLVFPDHFPMRDVELCTVIGNLTENAMEACDRQKDGERIICIRANTRTHIFVLSIENSFGGQAVRRENSFLSAKRGFEAMGIGINSASEIINQYGGEIRFSNTDRVFRVVLTLPLNG